jgi:hypothetical protein
MSTPHFGQTGGAMLAECGMMPAAFFDTVGASGRLKSKEPNSQNVKRPLTKFVKWAPSAHFPKFVLHREPPTFIRHRETGSMNGGEDHSILLSRLKISARRKDAT